MERVEGLEPTTFLVGSQVPYQLGDTRSECILHVPQAYVPAGAPSSTTTVRGALTV